MQLINNLRRSFSTKIPNALNILNYSKKIKQDNINSNIFVNYNDDCYTCYKKMEENDLNYIAIKNERNKIIGIFSKFDVKKNLIEYENCK